MPAVDWLLIPGGPGMRTDYLLELFGKIRPEGSVRTFDLPEMPPEDFAPERDTEIIETWRRDLVRVVSDLERPCVFGHSFGGMLAQSCPELQTLLVGAVFASSAPSAEWEKAAAAVSRAIATPELPEALEAFRAHPSEETSRGAYLAWAPLYAVDVEACRQLFARSGFIEWPLRMVLRGAFLGFQSRWTDWTFPTLCISGSEDRVTPLSIFATDPRFAGKSHVQIESVPGAGHFPWIEREAEFVEAIRAFEISLSGRSPRRPKPS